MKSNLLVFLSVMSFLLVSSISTQAQILDLTHVNAQTGLSDDFVYSVYQDNNGAMWFGTSTGLNRYNGRTIQVFKKENGLAENFVSCIAGDPGDNRLWLGHFNGTISKYDGTIFRELDIQLDQPVEYIVGSESAGFWAISRDGEMVQLADSVESVIDLSEFGVQSVTATLLIDNHLLLVGGAHGIVAFDLLERNLKSELLSSAPIRAISKLSATDILIVADSSVQILKYQDRSASTRVLNGISIYPNQKIQVATNEDNLWVSKDDTLEQYLLDRGSYSSILLHAFTARNGLSTAHIETIFNDADGHLWLSNRGQGLVQVMSPHAYFYSKETNDALSGLKVCVEASANELFVGGTNGLFLLDASSQRVELKLEKRVLSQSVTAASKTDRGDLWVGSESGELILVRGLEEVKRFKPNVPDRINHISIDQVGHIWVAYTTLGVSKYDTNGTVLNTYNTTNGLSHNNIRSIFHTASGGHWFSLYGSKLCYLKRDSFSYFGKEDGLNSFDFTGIAEDGSGRIWIATNDAGTYQFDNGQFVQVNFGDAWISDRIRELFILKQDQLVAVSGEGLYRCETQNPEAGLYRRFSQLDATSIVHNGISIGPSNVILLPTSDGLFQFPIDNTFNPILPRTSLLQTRIDGIVNPTAEASFKSSTKRYHFEFDAVDLTNKRPVFFWYKLEGYDEEWIGPTSSTFADYTNLDPGAYSFVIKSGHNEWSIGPQVDGYRFKVLAPFWMSWWFVSLATIFFFMLTYGLIVLRTKQLEAANKALESIVAQRTEQLREQNRDIRQFAYTVSHDLKAPANNIVALLTMVKAQNLVKKEGSELIKMLEDTGQHMRSNLERLMDLVKNYERVSSQSTTVSIESLINEILSNIHGMVVESDVKIQLQLDQKDVKYNRSDLTSIFHNLITNAIKYKDQARPLVIEIRTYQSEGFFVLSIKDNGLGINLAEDGDKLFQEFKRIHTNAEGSGVGLSLMKKMIEKRGGKIKVESAAGIGSEFSVYLKPKESDS